MMPKIISRTGNNLKLLNYYRSSIPLGNPRFPEASADVNSKHDWLKGLTTKARTTHFFEPNARGAKSCPIADRIRLSAPSASLSFIGACCVVNGSVRVRRMLDPNTIPLGNPRFPEASADVNSKHDWLKGLTTKARTTHFFEPNARGAKSCPIADRIRLSAPSASLSFIGACCVVNGSVRVRRMLDPNLGRTCRIEALENT